MRDLLVKSQKYFLGDNAFLDHQIQMDDTSGLGRIENFSLVAVNTAVAHLFRSWRSELGTVLPEIRKIDHRSSRNSSGNLHFKWLTEDSVMQRESVLERDFLYQVAVCPIVRSIYSQPVRFEYFEPSAPSKLRSYIPDFLIVDSLGRLTFVEIKHTSLLKRSRHSFDGIQKAIERMGFNFLFLTERELGNNDRLTCAELVKHASLAFSFRNDLHIFIKSLKVTTLDDICHEFAIDPQYSVGLIPIYQMWFNPYQPIHLSSSISWEKNFEPRIQVADWFNREIWRGDLFFKTNVA
jgi:hypothetical protein